MQRSASQLQMGVYVFLLYFLFKKKSFIALKDFLFRWKLYIVSVYCKIYCGNFIFYTELSHISIYLHTIYSEIICSFSSFFLRRQTLYCSIIESKMITFKTLWFCNYFLSIAIYASEIQYFTQIIVELYRVN